MSVAKLGKKSLTVQMDGMKMHMSREYLAFSDKCDHGGRELNYLVDQSKLQCSSFGHSEYDLDGKVLKGPAKNALPVFKAQRQGQLLKFSI
jgi:Rieske Fe-S protein